MKILGLPGIKFETQKWMHDLLSEMHEFPFDFQIAQYRHWSDDQDPDANFEAFCHANTAVDYVIAKSLGTVISTIAFDSFNFKPRKAVFIGTPLQRHSANSFELLSKFINSVPTLFIQQTSDFNGSYLELTEVVQFHQNVRIVEVPGDDHRYADIKGLQKIISSVRNNQA